jgi:hypothetical protein
MLVGFWDVIGGLPLWYYVLFFGWVACAWKTYLDVLVCAGG